MVFSDVVEATDNLSPDEQLALVEILQRRLAERNRKQLLDDVQAAREEFSRVAKSKDGDSILREIDS